LGDRGEEGKKLIVPSYPGGGDDEGHYTIRTLEEKIVRDYTGYDFDRIGSLTVFEFWHYLRDAVLYSCSQTEGGMDYLDKCWAAEQTEPDRVSLRKYFGKE